MNVQFFYLFIIIGDTSVYKVYVIKFIIILILLFLMCICRAEVAPPNKKLLFSQPKKKKEITWKV